MFASLKNKIKEETGNDIQSIPNRLAKRSGRLSSSASIASEDLNEQENQTLRTQCGDVSVRLIDMKKRYDNLEDEKNRLEKTNEILLESVNVAQTQKDLITNEQEKIQNLQQSEIDKLKNLLSFREQEGVDQLATIKHHQQQIENLTGELERLKMMEPMIEDIKDELETLRRLSQLEKNNLTTTLAAVEEENSHLKIRLQIVDQSRLETIASMNSDEKVQALVHERKLLEQHLEEAHLQLSDIKSSWSGQNLALETQLSRLSRQVAEETTEKRKALKIRDEFGEKIKALEFDLVNTKEQIEQRNNKIKLLEEEIDDLNLALRDLREEQEEEIISMKSKFETSTQESHDLRLRLSSAEEHLTEYVESSEQVTQALRKQNQMYQQQLTETIYNLESEKQEKLTSLLRNAEISQSEEILKKNLRIEQEEINELNDKIQIILDEKTSQLNDNKIQLDELKNKYKIKIDNMNHELNEKNKSIKILNQRLTDLKKTLQNEIKSNNNQSFDGSSMVSDKFNDIRNAVSGFNKVGYDDVVHGGSVVMDEVNFKYLKHVIVKFLTSREVEALHLIRAVATLLQLTNAEEKLLYDTLNWKMSWFGSKPVSVPSRFQ